MIEQGFNCTLSKSPMLKGGLLFCIADLFNKNPAAILLSLNFIMGSVIHPKISTVFHERSELISLWKRFLNWTDEQQSSRFLWMAFIILGHSIIFTPFALAVVYFSGNHFFYWPITIIAMMACLVVNLSGLPTKVTIPVFFISLIVDLVIIMCTITNGINLS